MAGLTLRVGAAVRQWFDSFKRVDSATAMCQVDSLEFSTGVDSGQLSTASPVVDSSTVRSTASTASTVRAQALGWWIPPSYPRCVAPVCVHLVWCVVCVWMGIARVCSIRLVPTCASACVSTHYAASSAPLGADCPLVSVLAADTTRCMFSPLSTTPLAHTPLAPPGGVCWSRVCHAHVVRRRLGLHATAWQLVA